MEKISAEIFVLKEKTGELINDIDTDQIFHNKYLSIVDMKLMGQYALDNLEGYNDFAKKVLWKGVFCVLEGVRVSASTVLEKLKE